MPEQRGKQHHRERVGETLKEEIRVFLEVAGDEHEAEETVAGITAAKGYIKRQLLLRMGKRHVPELIFVLDRSGKYGARIDEILGKLKKRKKK